MTASKHFLDLPQADFDLLARIAKQMNKTVGEVLSDMVRINLADFRVRFPDGL